MANILGKENLSKRGRIGPVNKGLAAAGEFMRFAFGWGGGIHAGLCWPEVPVEAKEVSKAPKLAFTAVGQGVF
jgi:hypothetical protein